MDQEAINFMSKYTTLLASSGKPLNGTITGLGRFNITGDASGAPSTIESVFTTMFGFLTIVGGLAFLVYFIIGALSWVTGGGDEQKVEKAQKSMTNAAIGLIAIVAAYAITWIVGEILGFKILNVAESLESIQ